MGVSISDLITLAKAGYTPGQVKELISLSEKSGQEPNGQDPKGQEPSGQDPKAEEPHAATGANDEPKPASGEPKEAAKNAQPAKTEDSVDYKALYEQAKADLDKAQKANISQNAGAKPPEDPEKNLRDLVGSYL